MVESARMLEQRFITARGNILEDGGNFIDDRRRHAPSDIQNARKRGLVVSRNDVHP